MNPKNLSNTELLARVKQMAEGERAATAALIGHLAELDERRLYLAEGCGAPSPLAISLGGASRNASRGRQPAGAPALQGAVHG